MKYVCLWLAALMAPPASLAQTEGPAQSVRFEGRDWRIAAREASVVRHLGRDALRLSGGRVWLDSDFGEGVIEFDLAYEEALGFLGPMFRAESDDRFEEFYVRAHLNEKPDAVQYTPVENGLSAWQIFSDANAIAPASQKFDAWNHLKVVVVGDRADIYFNSDAPVLHVPDLKTDIETGSAGLGATGAGRFTGFFSNISIRPLGDGDKIVGAPKDTPPLPDGLIGRWMVSAPFAESEVAKTLFLPDRAAKRDWRPLDVETNGIANLARLNPADENADTVFIRLKIKSDKARVAETRFGYSDRVRIYVNGKRTYFGDAGWRVRDYRFLGTVGFFDSAGLDLKKGDNEILFAVSETFGGWAFAGAIADRDGIEIVN